MEVILGTILLGFAVLATALVVSLHYHRKYSPILRQMSEQLAINTPKKTADDANTTEDADDANTTEDADEKLFRQVTDAIRKDQLYTVPKFGRTELVVRFRVNSNRISTAFSKAGTSVPEFIRECRLEHALNLMTERPDMPLVEIATASGFVHASTFTVDFKNKYGVSPMKYREENLKDKQKQNTVVQDTHAGQNKF
jgi:AraC-like DNA-binding protein